MHMQLKYFKYSIQVLSVSVLDMISNSSSSNGSFPPHLVSVSSKILSYIHCITASAPPPLVLPAFYTTYILLTFPLFVFVLYRCIQQCWQRHRTSSAAAMSHSDCVTCHLSVMELICSSGYALSCCGISWLRYDIMLVGFLLAKFTWYGEMMFHILTCVELYVAVVHPIAYRNLKSKRGIKIRNVAVGCVWTLCLMLIGLTVKDFTAITDLCLSIVFLAGISFSTGSILWVLVRPPPGDQSKDKERVDKSKLKALHTILLILGVLVLRLAWGLTWTVQDTVGGGGLCLVITYASVVNVPSSLILPLLFLQRAGAFGCCKKTNQ